MARIASYSFLPWARIGVANRITAADNDSSVKLRPSLPIELEVKGEAGDAGTLTLPVRKTVQLYGPGDVIGIESRAIVRTDPRNWITNFEPGYLPSIEFYDEDFPWRYTPAAPDPLTGNLRPWLTLVVLTEEEFKEPTDRGDAPLPFVRISDPAVFPEPKELWAWAHVHVNGDLAAQETEILSGDTTALAERLRATLGTNPDLAYSRIVCPRLLKDATAYHAFLMPTFESGRLAGLKKDPAATPKATHGAWEPYPGGATRADPEHYPYYHRWYFRTGAIGDFEYLVRLLEPKQVDKRVGTRDLDVQRRSANVPGITDARLKGVLKLGGALKVPREVFSPAELAELDMYDQWATPYPHPFQNALARLINLEDDYSARSALDANAASGLGSSVQGDADPLITPPLYGEWHALTHRLLTRRDGTPLPARNNWVHELNLDPRFRVAAGFGTRVIQDRQEELMKAAWDQVGDIVAAIERARKAEIARRVSAAWHDRHVKSWQALQPERTLTLTAPVHARVAGESATIATQLSGSLIGKAVTSTAMRRAIRPRSRLMRRLPFTDRIQPRQLLERVNSGEVSAAPPKVAPTGVNTTDELSESLLPPDVPAFWVNLLRRWPWFPWLVLLLGLAIAALVFFLLVALAGWIAGSIVAAAIAGAAIVGFRILRRWQLGVKRADRIREEDQTPGQVADLPRSPDFTLSDVATPAPASTGNTDSIEAIRFKAGLSEAYGLLVAGHATGAVPVRMPVNIASISSTLVQRLEPRQTIQVRTYRAIVLPPWIAAQQVESFKEPMAYPEFDMPMYKPLADISAELFLPNISLIEPNSITLLETNQRFIEAYMVGINHELGRELLWREFPSDNRGSYFRQFWDVTAYLAASTAPDAAALKESLRDIPPIHRWSQGSKLGDHDHREASGTKEEEAVLVIRGELLKRYPNTVIYAHRAKWRLTPDGHIDRTQERELVELTAAEAEQPPRAKLRTPLYSAKVEPDIFFFGFDLTVEAARGGTGENDTDDPGWYFVLKERPGEPRFGLDTQQQPALNTWNDLSWSDVAPGAPPGAYIRVNAGSPQRSLIEPTAPQDQEKHPQWVDDKALSWSGNASAAQLAYMLFQAPVLVAIHGAELLKKKS